jgi:peptide/nickel transport system permease protein
LLGVVLNDPSKKAYAFKQALKLNPSHQKAANQLERLRGEYGMKLMDEDSSLTIDKLAGKKFTSSTFYRVTKYTLGRAATIAATIFIGVFLTVVISNRTEQVDQSIQGKIEVSLRREEFGWILADEETEAFEQALFEAEEEAGLHLPFLQRHLRWTVNALTLEWGDLVFSEIQGGWWYQQNRKDIKTIVVERLPTTLMLVGSAYLIIFLFGIPVALSISRRHGSWQDRLFSFLAPVSSVPSWVLGVLLIMIFAVELRLLPLGGMFDDLPPETKTEYIGIVLKHMILPVSAIVISLLFQLIHTWRTFYLIYSKEYYIELAQAKGLSARQIQKDYIQKPSLPFIVTSFAITLVGFWQMTTALEVVFDWPGIGQLYVTVLPHFWGESMYPGELLVVIALVVIFAYLLGSIVLTLDVVYAIVDPRMRIGRQGVETRRVIKRARRRFLRKRQKTRRTSLPVQPFKRIEKPIVRVSISERLSRWWEKMKTGLGKLKSITLELVRYPSAVFGLFIIAILVGGSAYAVIALPYAEVADTWRLDAVTGKYYDPRMAWPAWVNLFRSEDLLSSIVIRSQDDPSIKESHPGSNETTNLSITFTFDYPFGEAPEEVIIYIDPHYEVKRPFIVPTWGTPDGREIELKPISTDVAQRINIVDILPSFRGSSKNTVYDTIQNTRAISGADEIFVLFEGPSESDSFPHKGEYTLRLDGILFEEGADYEAELVVLGQVFGLAGTDNMRRDLLVPLLWGMPFALAFGLFGTLLTTLVSMVLAATGVWFGGRVDAFVQRITEANVILPVIGISVVFYALYNVDIWTILAIVIVLNAFGSPTKSFRAAFMQVREASYIEAAQAYGASNWRIVFRYMIPRIVPVLIPQLVALIPSYVFLEATLGMFNIKSVYPTWGKVIYQALMHGYSWGSRFWVLQPLALLLLTGFAFTLLGSVLDRILNPGLRGV